MLDGWLPGLREALAGLRPERDPDLLEPPLSFADAEGRPTTVRPYRESDREELVGMYVDFDPAQRAQGTPPVGEDAVRAWLDDVLDGVGAVALHDGGVVGHVAFVPDGTGRHELAIFVHQDHQRAGVGSKLIRAGLAHAKAEGVGYVWLSVESWKHGVQRFYRSVGFTVVNPMGAAHRMSRYL